MDNSADCPSRDRRSLAKTDSQRIVQSHGGIGEGSKKLENSACCPKRRIFRVWLGAKKASVMAHDIWVGATPSYRFSMVGAKMFHVKHLQL